MPTARDLVHLLTRPGPEIPPEHQRVWVLLSVGTTTAMGVHLAYTALFLALGVVEMAAANVGSMAAYSAAHLLVRRDRYLAAVLICLVELCAHQMLAVHYLGWGAGFQLYLLVLPAVIFALPGRRFGLKAALTAVPAAVFVALQATHDAPAYTLPPWGLQALEIAAITTVFALLGFFMMSFARAAEVAEASTRAEYARAETLLRNILPGPIAARLKQGGGVVADGYADASVLFADLVGFTALSSRLAPREVVGMLDGLFCEFDDLVGARGLEKIKTIGDAYMVAAGVPEARADHAAALAELAFAMLAVVERRAAGLDAPLAMRIGIHTGPVVAGVIGRRKFSYDLWGDTVNTASRMESHGVPGAVQVSRATRDALGEGWDTESRGEIVVKGKGTMEVFLLRRPAPGAPRG